LRVWQQNLNKSLSAQQDMLGSLKPSKYDIALLQEPHFDFKHQSRTNLRFTSIYPTPHSTYPDRSRSLILMNTHLSSSSWSQIPLESSDMTAVELTGEFGMLRIINVYNDCDHNDAL
ncbi:hypothetical protein C8R44DRAFT_577501, partial [Mycena epipterygia]